MAGYVRWSDGVAKSSGADAVSIVDLIARARDSSCWASAGTMSIANCLKSWLLGTSSQRSPGEMEMVYCEALR